MSKPLDKQILDESLVQQVPKSPYIVFIVLASLLYLYFKVLEL